MSKVTSKLQVTIPKALALRYGIRPGDRVRWELLARGAVMVRADAGGGGDGTAGSVGEGVPWTATRASMATREGVARTAALLRDPGERVDHFDRESRWIEALLSGVRDGPGGPEVPETGVAAETEAEPEAERIARVKRERGWSREDLYGDRGHPR